MGTRHLTKVTHNGQVKVAQYGQWDGYPSGQGLTVHRFLTEEFDRKSFLRNLSKVKELQSDGDYRKLGPLFRKATWTIEESEQAKEMYPEIHRDTGAKILSLIQSGKARVLKIDDDFENDKLFCEYVYHIDLDTNTLTVKGGYPDRGVIDTFDIENMPSDDDYLAVLNTALQEEDD